MLIGILSLKININKISQRVFYMDKYSFLFYFKECHGYLILKKYFIK